MGTGKSQVAKKLGALLKRPVISTDRLIEAQEHKSIADIFQTSGEAHFRALEKKIINEISQKGSQIIDCGGGVVLDPENVVNLKRNGTLICLVASAETILERVQRNPHRPLLKGADPFTKIKELLEARKSHYAQADATIATDGKKAEDVCQEVLKTNGYER